MRISEYTFTKPRKAFLQRVSLSLLLIAFSLQAAAQSKYRLEVPAPEAKLFNGIAVGVDGVGFGMKAAGARFANMEVMGRVNILEKYFPVVELGVGECDREGNEQSTVFHISSPYYRAGLDYCLTKKRNGNRLFLGFRYGYSKYSYDYANPDFQDPYWGGPVGVTMEDIKASKQWLELCVGIETKLWQYIRMGWSFRYKSQVKDSDTPNGPAWYVPGYGRNDITCFGGTVNLIFELQRWSALNYKKQAKNTVENLLNGKK